MISSRFSSETPRMHSLKQTIHRSSSSSQGSDASATEAISFISTRLLSGLFNVSRRTKRAIPSEKAKTFFSISSPSSIFRASRFNVSSANSSEINDPRHSKNLTSQPRNFSYFPPAVSGSGSNMARSFVKASGVSSHSFLGDCALSIRPQCRYALFGPVCHRSLPLALEHEPAPVKRRPPLRSFPHIDLRRAQGRRRSHSVLQHPAVEPLHQLRGGRVMRLPQTRHHTRRSRVHKSARQPNQSFAFDFLAQAGLTRAQNDQLRRQSQIEDFVQPQEAVLRMSSLVHQRQHHAR